MDKQSPERNQNRVQSKRWWSPGKTIHKIKIPAGVRTKQKGRVKHASRNMESKTVQRADPEADGTTVQRKIVQKADRAGGYGGADKANPEGGHTEGSGGVKTVRGGRGGMKTVHGATVEPAAATGQIRRPTAEPAAA